MTEMNSPKKDKKRRRGRKSEEKNNNSSGVFENSGENVANYQAHSTPLIQLDEDAPTWYEYGRKLPGRNDTTASDPPDSSDQSNSSLVAKYRSIGDMIYQKEIQLSGKNSSRGSDERWVENTMKKGTLKDRIAAMSVTVSSDPVHKFYALDGLLSMVGCSESGGKTNSRVAQLTAEALEDLFINTFLPADRKLLTLSQRPLYRYEASKNGKKSKTTLSPRILLLWRFEEMVKEKYETYLRKYLAQTLQDGAEMQKTSTLQLTATLLSSVPEGESELLAMMVNKLGDPGKKTAAAAGHQLRLVLQKHPNMQIIIAREVQQLAHRPHLSPKALYNCIVFLNQLKLEKEGVDASKKPATLADTKSLPASLIKTYFRLFEVAVKKSKSLDPESEEAGMKSRLLSALLTGVNRAHPYLPEEDKDMEEHIDALYRVVHTSPPAASTQALMLLFHLVVGSQQDEAQSDDPKSDTQTARQDRFYRALYATLSKPTLVTHGKHLTMYFNLLYKAMKYDTDINRVNVFAKRLMCTVLHSNAAPIAGSIFLLNEISKTHDGLRACFEDVPDELNANLMFDDTKREPRAALVCEGVDKDTNNKKNLYPPCWELALVSHHFHPSVSKFANTMGNLEYAGDPLKDFALAPFLDKFAYRNPKSRGKLSGHYKRGESVAERRSGTDGMIQSRLELPMNDPSFLEREDVSEQDEFFRKFFVERARRDEIKGITRENKQAVDEDQQDEAVDGALDAAEDAIGWDTGKSFEDYEQTWETDEEEEAFVDSLAEQLMEDAADGEIDFDDEDPDMEGWNDMYSDNDEENSNTQSREEDQDFEMADLEDDEISDNDDDIPDMQESDEDSGDESGDEQAMDDQDAFMDAGDSNDSDEDDPSGDSDHGLEPDEEEISAADDDDDDDGDDLAFVNDSEEGEDSEEEDEDEAMPQKSRKKGKNTLATYADADEYEEMVTKSWNELKRGVPVSEEKVAPEEKKTSRNKQQKRGKK